MKLRLSMMVATLVSIAVFTGCFETNSGSGGDRAPGDPGRDATGYIGTERGSWEAWHNVMPGSPHRLHVEGVVTVASASYEAGISRRPSTTRTLHFDVNVRDTGRIGAQVLTEQTVKYSAEYDGNHRQATIHLPDGETIEVPIERAH